MSTLMGEGGAFGPCSSQRSPGATSIFVYPFVGGREEVNLEVGLKQRVETC